MNEFNKHAKHKKLMFYVWMVNYFQKNIYWISPVKSVQGIMRLFKSQQGSSFKMYAEFLRTKERMLEHPNLLILFHKSMGIVVRIIRFSDKHLKCGLLHRVQY